MWHCLVALGFIVEVKAVYRIKNYVSDETEEIEQVKNDEVDDQGRADDAYVDDDDYYDGDGSDSEPQYGLRYEEDRSPRWRHSLKLIKIPYPQNIDEFSSVGPWKRESRAILMTSKSFMGIAEYCVELEGERGFTELLQKCARAKIEQDLVWIKKPMKYAKNGNFASYGNQPTTNCSYVAGALIATLVR